VFDVHLICCRIIIIINTSGCPLSDFSICLHCYWRHVSTYFRSQSRQSFIHNTGYYCWLYICILREL